MTIQVLKEIMRFKRLFVYKFKFKYNLWGGFLIHGYILNF